jgi:hypothetical protein
MLMTPTLLCACAEWEKTKIAKIAPKAVNWFFIQAPFQSKLEYVNRQMKLASPNFEFPRSGTNRGINVANQPAILSQFPRS